MNLQRFQDSLQKVLMPIAIKLENQKHLQAIKDGMLSVIPVLIIGSFCLLPIAIKNLLPASGLKEFITANMSILTFPTTFTTDVVSLFVAYGIADALAKSYDLKSKNPGITAIIVQLILCCEKGDKSIMIGNIGAQGIFVAIISAFLVVEITRFMRERNMVIKMPKSVPPMVSDSMSSLFPAALSILLATAISLSSVHFAGVQFPNLIMKILAPAVNNVDTLPVICLIMLFTQLFWFFGLHGQAIVGVVWTPFAIQYAAENAANYAAGLEVTHIFTNNMFFTMLACSGSGLTIGLVMLMMRSKAKGLKAIGKVSIVPAFFGINEPVIYGCPIVMNPFLFIPFVFGPILVCIIDYLAISFGLVGKPIVIPPGFLPPGLGAFLMTLDWRAPILVIFTLILMTLIYYPFFKAMEANELRIEAELEK